MLYVSVRHTLGPYGRQNQTVDPKSDTGQDTIVRHLLSSYRMSLSEYVVSRGVASAVEDLADRQVFSVSEEAWERLQEVLERPATAKPKVAALLAEDSVLD